MDTRKRDEMFQRSGEVESTDPLLAFIYVMIRNGAGPGVIFDALDNMTDETMRYTNGWIAEYAKYVTEKMRKYDLNIGEKEIKEETHE